VPNASTINSEKGFAHCQSEDPRTVKIIARDDPGRTMA
jgi:hypothetical protein